MEVDDLTPLFSVDGTGCHESLAKYSRMCISIYHINVKIYIDIIKINLSYIYVYIYIERERGRCLLVGSSYNQIYGVFV